MPFLPTPRNCYRGNGSACCCVSFVLLPTGGRLPERLARTVSRHDAESEPAGTLSRRVRGGLLWRGVVFSVSHASRPFPPQDGLYGAEPDPADDFGLRLGALALRGERGVLVIGLDSFARVTSNPFFPYLRERVTEALPPPR